MAKSDGSRTAPAEGWSRRFSTVGSRIEPAIGLVDHASGDSRGGYTGGGGTSGSGSRSRSGGSGSGSGSGSCSPALVSGEVE